MILAQVIVRPRTSIFDPQGEAVKQALRSMGLTTVTQANVGKCIELHLDTDDVAKAQEALEGVCRDLLSNPVIEDFELVVMDMDAKAKATKPTKSAAKTAPSTSRPRIKKAASITAKPEIDVAEIAESLRKQEKAVKKLAKEAKKASKKAKDGKKKKKS